MANVTYEKLFFTVALPLISFFCVAIIALLVYGWQDHKETEQRNYIQTQVQFAETANREAEKLQIIHGMQLNLQQLTASQESTEGSVEHIKKEMRSMKTDINSVCNTLDEYADMMSWKRHGCQKNGRQ